MEVSRIVLLFRWRRPRHDRHCPRWNGWRCGRATGADRNVGREYAAVQIRDGAAGACAHGLTTAQVERQWWLPRRIAIESLAQMRGSVDPRSESSEHAAG